MYYFLSGCISPTICHYNSLFSLFGHKQNLLHVLTAKKLIRDFQEKQSFLHVSGAEGMPLCISHYPHTSHHLTSHCVTLHHITSYHTTHYTTTHMQLAYVVSCTEVSVTAEILRLGLSYNLVTSQTSLVLVDDVSGCCGAW